MCKRCTTVGFTFHSVKELALYVEVNSLHYNMPEKDLLKIWLERGYMTKLMYLEYMYETR